MSFKRITRPVILGIVGDSASGKSTIADGITKILGSEKVVSICTDDYHKFDRRERAQSTITALDPEANYLDIAEQHIQLLRRGQPILKPVYDHVKGEKGKCEYVEPREYVIVEGLLGYGTRKMRDCYDVKVYLEPDEDLRIKWKLRRDTEERGYSKERVLEIVQRRRNDLEKFIQPQRTSADMVVSFYPPGGNNLETGAHLNVRHTLRRKEFAWNSHAILTANPWMCWISTVTFRMIGPKRLKICCGTSSPKPSTCGETWGSFGTQRIIRR